MAASCVTVIGLGLVGSALANALAKVDEVRLTVFNRTPAKAQPYRERGIHVASNALEAVGASNLVILSVTDYEASQQFLSQEVLQACRGKVLLQLSNGSTTAVEGLASTCAEAGCDYLDGCILCYPKDVGTDKCRIVVSGPQELYAKVEAVLKSFAPLAEWVGPDYASASAINLAAVGFIISAYAGYMQGAALARAHAIPMPVITATCNGLLPMFAGVFQSAERAVAEKQFDPAVLQMGPASGLVHELKDIQASCAAAGMDDSFAGALAAMFAKGSQDEDMATVYKTFLKQNKQSERK